MPSSTLTKVYDFADQLGRGVHNFGVNTFKLALTNTAPAQTNTMLGNITQIAASGGYTAGGYTLAGVTWAEATGVGKLTITDHTITASGGAVGPFRYLVLYNDSATSPLDALVGWYDYGSAVTLNDGENLVVDFDGTNGVLTIT
jgi:hypothetical protein